MVAWFGLDVTVEVAFDDDPLAPSPSWTDISTLVRNIDEVRRGKASEFQPMSPGVATFTLDNRQRQFDPEYSSGPYYGKLLPLRRIRAVVSDPAPMPVFDGFITGWPASFRGAGADSFVQVRAIDLWRRLGNATLNRSAYEAAVAVDRPARYWPLQEQNTTASAQYVDVVDSALVRFRPGEAGFGQTPVPLPVIDTIDRMVDVSSAVRLDRNYDGFGGWVGSDLACAAPLSVDVRGCEFWVRNVNTGDSYSGLDIFGTEVGSDSTFFLVSFDNSGVLRVAFSNATDDVSFAAELTGSRLLDGFRHVALWYDGSDVHLYVDGVLRWSKTPSAGATTYSPGVSFWAYGCSVAHVAVYGDGDEPDWLAHYIAGVTAFDNERGGARIGRVLDEIGLPDEFRDLAAGDTYHGPYIPNRRSAADYLRAVETAENGAVFVSAAGKVAFRDRQWHRFGSTRRFVTDDEGNILTDDDDNPLYVDSVPLFADDGTGWPFMDITIDAATVESLRNRTSVSYRESDGWLEVRDEASIEAYDEAAEALSAPTIYRVSAARGLAEWRVESRKDPSTRITRIVTNPRVVPEVLGLELADRVDVKLTPLGLGSPIERRLVVAGIEHRLSPSGEGSTTLYLSPAELAASEGPWFVVGDPVLGKIGATAGNKIPF